MWFANRDTITSRESIVAGYLEENRRKSAVIIASGLFLTVVSLWSCCIGTVNLTPGRVFVTYLPWAKNLVTCEALSLTEQTVFVMLRLPRICIGLLAGAGLGVCGCVMQAITGNTMASPFTTGLSGAAAFGAALIIVFDVAAADMQKTSMVTAAFCMSLLCALLVYGISVLKGLGPATLVLVGIALNYLFNALYSVMQLIASETQLSAIVYWTFGNLTSAVWRDIAVTGIFLSLSFPVFQKNAWCLNLMAQNGDETAAALGVPVKRVRIICGFGITLLTAVIVSFTGTIGFVGLVAPHISRLVIGSNYRVLLPLSAFTGAFLVIVADIVGRTLFAPAIIPVGIVISFVGVPLFLSLIFSRWKERI